MTHVQVDVEDRQSLQDYLTQRGLVAAGEAIGHRVLVGGVSNKTVWVRLATGQQLVLKQALSKLRVKADWFSDPARVEREAAALRTLAELLPGGSVASFVFSDEAAHVLAMSAVPEPHDNLKTLLLGGKLKPEWTQQFATILALLHRESSSRVAELADPFADRSFFESLRLEPYYAYSAQRVPETRPFLDNLIEETRARQDALTHGDYSPKNFLVHRDRLVLLDHEVVHLGDPAFDVGFATAHLLSKANHVVSARDAFVAAAASFHDHYLDRLGDVTWRRGFEERAVRHTLGCLVARVVGRSPLEYLTEREQRRQLEVSLGLMRDTPVTFAELRRRFASSLPEND